MNIDTSFVPLELDGASWSALEPLYTSLRDRTVDDAADLERLLLDRSELDAQVSEAGNRLYAAMT
ncbi:MAG: M3 family oligoendopeptidase, partial [Planctomycetota bacterium]